MNVNSKKIHQFCRFKAEVPPNATPEELDEFKKRQLTVQNRGINVIRTWLGKRHSYDIEYSPVLDRIEDIITIVRDAGLEKQAQHLKDSLEKHVSKSL